MEQKTNWRRAIVGRGQNWGQCRGGWARIGRLHVVPSILRHFFLRAQNILFNNFQCNKFAFWKNRNSCLRGSFLDQVTGSSHREHWAVLDWKRLREPEGSHISGIISSADQGAQETAPPTRPGVSQSDENNNLVIQISRTFWKTFCGASQDDQVNQKNAKTSAYTLTQFLHLDLKYHTNYWGSWEAELVDI